jgi:UPF0755 protein
MKASRENLRGLAGVAAALVIIALIHLVKPGVSSVADFPCLQSSTTSATIDVRSGETGSEIANELFEKGVIASSEAFFRLAVSDPRSQRIAPGLHKVDLRICAKDALEQLLDSKRIGNLLTINEGAWNSEVRKSLVSIGYSPGEISQAFARVSVPAPFKTLEGLLFPAQYSFDTSTPVNEILKAMIDRGKSELDRSGIAQGSNEFSSVQLLTIASLVQAEGDTKDFAKISQVVRNRLAKGMPLQFDSTVHYIKQSRGSVFLSTQSTFINSPYNTYRRYGLPPGPINNPGFDAMYAATHPEKGAWLFFITVAPGDTRFTDSIDQFNSWKVLYKKNLKAGKFRSK